MVNIGDIINLNDEKAIVISKIEDNGINYVFVNKVLDDETNVTEDYYLVKVDNNTFEKLTDENEINRLFPKVQENLKQVLIDNGIDINLFNNAN